MHAMVRGRKPMPRLLDLYCGAGGAAQGYADAGWDVVGVDLYPQPNYPFEFHQANAIEFLAMLDQLNEVWMFDAIHASPPCQRFSTMTKRWARSNEHPDLIAPTREWLVKLELPYIIENVVGAPLHNPVLLCGSMFGLPLRRHRLFESNLLLLRPECDHRSQSRVIGVYGHPGGSSKRDGITFGSTEEWRAAMGTPWMNAPEMAEAIPPAYTHYLGQQLYAALG